MCARPPGLSVKADSLLSPHIRAANSKTWSLQDLKLEVQVAYSVAAVLPLKRSARVSLPRGRTLSVALRRGRRNRVCGPAAGNGEGRGAQALETQLVSFA